MRETEMVGATVAAVVVIVSLTVFVPPRPVAVQVQVEGYPTQEALAVPLLLPLAATLPLPV